MNPPGIYERQEPEAGPWDRNLPCVVKAKRPVKLERSEQGGKALQMRQSIKAGGETAQATVRTWLCSEKDQKPLEAIETRA